MYKEVFYDYAEAVSAYRKTFSNKGKVLEQPPDPCVKDMLALKAAAEVRLNIPVLGKDKVRSVAKTLGVYNVLVLTNGCASFPLMKLGYCTRGAADKVSEPLRGILKAANLPAALHVGECLDNSRSAAIFRAVADACGQPLHRMPLAYVSPEWSNEKGTASPLSFRIMGISSYHCV
jgi:carbon-monoxide dehydrogenase catalytic subunit